MNNEELRLISDRIFQKDKEKQLDDLIALAEVSFRTEIKDGKPHIKYINPISPEMLKKMADATGYYYPTSEMIESERKLFENLQPSTPMGEGLFANTNSLKPFVLNEATFNEIVNKLTKG